MQTIVKLVPLVILGILSPAAACASETPAYTFAEEGPRYTFSFSFDVIAEPDQVLDVLYPFEHLRQFSRRVADVELLDEGHDWQTVRFTYTTWLSRMCTTFRRELDRPNRTIRFRMVDAARSGLPVPLPSASSGEYRVELTANGVRVRYRQMVETHDSFLLGLWMARARSEAIQFSADLEDHVRAELH